jgi:hypothetical protein
MSLLDWLQIVLGFRYVLRRAIVRVFSVRTAKPEVRPAKVETAESAEHIEPLAQT